MTIDNNLCDDCGAEVERGQGGGLSQQLIIEGKWRCEPCWKLAYPRYEEQKARVFERYQIVIVKDMRKQTWTSWILDTYAQNDPQPKDAWEHAANRELVYEGAVQADAYWAADRRICDAVLRANEKSAPA